MSLLRRVLYLDALVWGVLGIAWLAAPRFTVATAAGQPALPDYEWLRLAGAAAVALALLMVLVGHHLEQAWWWSWAFVVLEAGVAAVATLNAAFGLPESAAAWPWWTMAGVSWAFGIVLLWGLARAGVERPPT